MTIQRFPDLYHQRPEDDNPAIQLFGRRFYKDQTEIEYLAEFLLLFDSPKRVGRNEWGSGFPQLETLRTWPVDTPLEYRPEARLILKLFAFLGSSKLETRHECHRQHYGDVLDRLRERMGTSDRLNKDDALKMLQQLLAGLVGVAQNRTWCTNVFLPICEGFLACETIWKHTQAKKNENLKWDDVVSGGKFFTFSAHDFFARGGELLYLQLLNLLRKDEPFLLRMQESATHASDTSTNLRRRVEEGLREFLGAVPALNTLADWVEAADPAAKRPTEYARCGWCPEDSLVEAYLFAYELANICEAAIDPLEKVEMLKICCIMQVLRSLCAQAARCWKNLAPATLRLGGLNGFAWIVTDPELEDRGLKEAAKRNLLRVQEMIHGALRSPLLEVEPGYDYRKAEEQGPDLLLKLGKKIDFIQPWKGPGARFVLGETLLRYLVLALIPPGSRMTFTSYQERLFTHYGIAVTGPKLDQALRWTYPSQDPTAQGVTQGTWLEFALTGAGFMISLSDSVALVQNPFSRSDRVEK